MASEESSPVSSSPCSSLDLHLGAAPLISRTPPAPPPPISPSPPPPPQSVKVIISESRNKTGSRALPNTEDEIKQTIERLPSWRLDLSGDSKTWWLACNKQVRHIGQEGPTCGLVALCMAAKWLQDSEKDPDAVLASARKKGYTIQGEMFSASNALKFAEEEFGLGGGLLSDGLNSHVTDVITHLARGLPVLLPYDRDSNNEPTCRKGHSAHWAVLTGFAVSLPPEADIPLPCQQDDGEMGLFIHLPPWSEQVLSSVPRLIQQAVQLYVFARQGKSRLLGAWPYDSLAISNQNLVEYDPKLEGEYVYHPEGLAAGLAGKLILLQ